MVGAITQQRWRAKSVLYKYKLQHEATILRIACFNLVFLTEESRMACSFKVVHYNDLVGSEVNFRRLRDFTRNDARPDADRRRLKETLRHLSLICTTLTTSSMSFTVTCSATA